MKGLGSGARRGLAERDPSPYNRGVLERTMGVAVIELAQIGDVRECCGERYLLVEQQRGTLVRRWYTHANDPDQRPLTSCRRCASVLLPYPPQSERAAGTRPSYAGPVDLGLGGSS